MTMPGGERALSRLERWAGKIMVFCAIGTCVCFIGLTYLQLQVSGQARDGRKARVTQCRTFPVAIKLYEAAARYGLITQVDLGTYLAAAPKGCPTPTPTP